MSFALNILQRNPKFMTDHAQQQAVVFQSCKTYFGSDYVTNHPQILFGPA
jgi:hypothetical protein